MSIELTKHENDLINKARENYPFAENSLVAVDEECQKVLKEVVAIKENNEFLKRAAEYSILKSLLRKLRNFPQLVKAA